MPPSSEIEPRLGIVGFAVAMLVLSGLFNLAVALTALLKSTYFAGTPAFGSFASWGIFGLVIAGVLFLTAALILERRRWGRILGIVVAIVGATGHLLFSGANTTWSVLIIAIDVIIIWALAAHGEVFTAG